MSQTGKFARKRVLHVHLFIAVYIVHCTDIDLCRGQWQAVFPTVLNTLHDAENYPRTLTYLDGLLARGKWRANLSAQANVM